MSDFLPHSDFAGQNLSSASSQEITEADVIVTAALGNRPARPPDFAAENQALRTLAQHLMDDPQSMLKTLVCIALDLCRADTVGVSLLETQPNGESVFRWVAIAGALEQLEQNTIPGNFSPCATTLSCNQPQLYTYPERYFTYLYHPQFPIVEGLLIPLCVGDRALGTLWILSHNQARHFDAEDQRLIMSLGGFTASALQSMQQLQQQATTALRESENFNQQILDNSDDCIKVLDLEGRILFMSQGGQRLLGLKDMTPFLNTSWAEFWQGADRQAAIAAINQAIIGEVSIFQGYRPTLSGEPKWWEIKLSPIRGGNGQIERLLCISRDITERRQSEEKRQQAQERLQKSEQHLSAMFLQATVGLSEISLDGHFQRVNDELCRIMGRSRQEILAIGVADVTHPEDVLQSLEAFAQLMATGKPVSLDKRYVRPDGTIVWANSSLSRLDDEQGCPRAILAVTVDLTERKLAQEELRQSEERYRAIVNQAITGIAYTDLSGKLTLVNQKYCDIVGYSAAELSELRMHEITHPEDLPRNDELYNRMVADGRPFEIEKRYIRKDGSIVWVNNYVSAICDRQGKPQSAVAIVLDITERKQAEAALREAQESLTIAVEAAQMGTWYLDLIKDFAPRRSLRHDQIFGYDTLQTEWGQKIAKRHVVEEDHEIFDAAFARAIATGELDFEVRIQWSDGSIHWMAARGRFYYDENGKPICGAGVNFDITHNKQVEAQLRSSEAKYRTLFNSMDEGFCVIEVLFDDTGQAFDYRFIEANLAFEKHTGLVNVIGKTIRELVPQHEAHWFEIYGKIALTGVPARFENSAAELGRFFDVYAFRIGEPNERKVAVLFNDISNRKQAEAEREQIIANERHYANQLQGLTFAALAINSALSVEEVLKVITDQAAAIIGVHQSVTSMTIDQNWTQAINAIHLSDKYAAWRGYEEQPDGSGIYACVCNVNRPMRMTQAELEAHPQWQGFSKAAGKHPPMRGWLAAPLVGRDENNMGLIQLSDKYQGEFTPSDESILVQLAQMASIAVENARLYEAEQQARAAAEALREEAQAANRVKDEFLAVLSHELRSPLNPILGWSSLLLTNKLDAVKTNQALAIIQRNAKLQSELIEDLLNVSRILQGKLNLNIAPVSLPSTIRAAMETVRLAAEAKSIKVEANLQPDVSLVWGDSTRLQQVIWNLLSNAVKFTPEGGQVNIELQYQQAHAQILVSDTGQGIAPDFLPYVFDYFRQANAATTRKFGGLGLGLAIVRYLVELHGGTVKAESLGLDMGATFTVRLPLLPIQANANQNDQSSELSSDLNGIQVLVVDDELDSREFIAFVLEQAGAQVITATSANEALASLIRSQPDILLSDIGMPEMDGYMLMQQVRALPPEQGGQIPAIALTAYAGDFNQQQAMQAGFQQHISKPVEPEVLVRAITNLLSNT